MDHYSHPWLPMLFDPLTVFDRQADRFAPQGGAAGTALERGPMPATTLPRYQHWPSSNVDVLEVELPGVDKGDVKMDVKGFTLCVAAERVMHHDAPRPEAVDGTADKPPVVEEPAGAEGSDQVRVNKEAGGSSTVADRADHMHRVKYSAKFSLSKVADINGITAEFKNGLLRVTVPHKQPAEPRKIVLH
jgi:HSP20 family molecular chaperone IbpA